MVVDPYRIVFCGNYNDDMARGWESKAVEAQIEDSNEDRSGHTREPGAQSSEQVQARIQRANLLLSRRGIVKQLETSNNHRYSELLRKALADLDRKIAE